MKKTLITIVIALAAAASAAAQCSDADKKALEAFDRAWAAAGQNGDKAALTGIYADDYVAFPDMTGKGPAIDATMATFERNKGSQPTTTTTYDHYLMSCTPNGATVTHRNKIVSNNGAVTYSRSVHMLEKRGGKWMVVGNAGHTLDDNATVWYLEQDWNDAFWKKDKAWFDANFASDFSNVGSGDGAVTGKTDEIASIIGDKNTYDLVETTDMNVHVDGNTARVTGIFHLKGKDAKGAAFDTRIRYTDIWIKRDGRWVAWSSQGTLMK